ncbi:cell surface lipoprotein [Methanolobus sediminis]|uniref:Cell surface lipoprotein n=1 Tax=Methanolobus sediminis TaxID=3072978 RepID=A0AA51YMP7_9EURY|nr:cell surface lipoprotein [Methanolobus sediminis]WMW26249.1 cell surface lipoprotein [Methanolobus sediminis]
MTKKCLILITILMLAGVLVSGCADNADNAATDEQIEDATTEDVAEATDVVGDGIDYGIRMEYYGMMKPSEIEINRGDTLVWTNYKPQNTFVLVSDDGLFEDQEMYVHDTYNYTFTESGTYTFSVVDYPDMTLTATVN